MIQKSTEKPSLFKKESLFHQKRSSKKSKHKDSQKQIL
jgi:hypothetical protein